jgi:leucine dehydrogenase
MSGVLTHPEYDDHELVVFHRHPPSGLRAIVAVHSTALGRGLGGCRVYPYASEADAVTDVLRLSRGMTYKAALAGLRQGGGKAVVIADPRLDKTPEMMRAMGRLVQALGGRYVIAEDSGTDEADMREVAHETAFIGGGAAPPDPQDPGDRDTSAATALGVFHGIQAAARFRLGREDLQGLRVSIQGVGKVGQVLAQHLHEAGARLYVCDAHAPAWRPACSASAPRRWRARIWSSSTSTCSRRAHSARCSTTTACRACARRSWPAPPTTSSPSRATDAC